MKNAAATDAAAGKPEFGQLPVWNLGDLYAGPECAELKRDLGAAANEAKAFAERYKGKLATLESAAFGRAIAAYEAVDEKLSRILSYAQLLYSANVGDPAVGRFYQTMQEQVTEISTELLFFRLEINGLEEADITRLTAAPEAARYRPWLRDVRLFRPHQLPEDMERLLHEKQVAGRSAWNRLFDETMADMRFPYDGRSLTSEEILHLLSDADGRVREKAGKVFGVELGRHARVFALVTNTLAKDKEIEDRWRKLPKPQSARHLSNQVEDEVVDALVAAVKAAYPRLSHRYYRLKAKWFGQEALDWWDRNAPLPKVPEATIPWPRARTMVLDAYRGFSPVLSDLAGRFFDRAWIDAGVREGKAGGAFSHPTVPSAHPYILMNYQGKRRDVMTLAHELGHGVHQLLAAPQGQLLADTPLTLAETASVFGEMLTFRALLAAETDASQRKAMLAGKVEDMLNTVVRQIAFYNFESKVHAERRGGELTAERLCEIWLEIQGESLGPAIRFGDEYRWYWAYIPHFVHSPFYVYAYAFGECLVNSLYALYAGAHPGFAEKYLDLLRAGGTLRHKELLAPFGLDAGDPGFWAKGLGVISGLIDELEAMG
jgi:oligoendopeptidase F